MIWTYIILAVYLARCVTYAIGRHWGPMLYWTGAIWLTVVVEFILKRYP